MRLRGNWSAQLTIVFGVVVASLIAATGFSQWQLATVGRTSRDIATNFAPSIEHLAEARGEMRHLQIVLREYVDAQRTPEPNVTIDTVEDARSGMDDAIARYLALPSDAKERALSAGVLRAKDALNLAVERCLETTRRSDVRTTDARMRDVSAAADALSTAITRDIELNAGRSHESATRIERTYDRSTYLACALVVLCVAITIVGALTLRRAIRAHTRLQEQHQTLLEARAFELEQFAGRVAHDILSPLSVVSLTLGVVKTAATNDMRGEAIGRASSAIKRIDRLVSGLLAFAVAGARPEEGVDADVNAVMADLAPELRAAAEEAHIDLDVSVDVSSPAACHPGVLTSIVSNLARNAIKYIGDGEKRRVDIRASESRKTIRLEVEDTGPGLSADLGPHVFDPYVRGKDTKKGGIGLGLATVKRVVTAHGGVVGVRSVAGVGCTFWVELPKHVAAGGVAANRRVAHAT